MQRGFHTSECQTERPHANASHRRFLQVTASRRVRCPKVTPAVRCHTRGLDHSLTVFRSRRKLQQPYPLPSPAGRI